MVPAPISKINNLLIDSPFSRDMICIQEGSSSKQS
jgi:hypothetical protein